MSKRLSSYKASFYRRFPSLLPTLEALFRIPANDTGRDPRDRRLNTHHEESPNNFQTWITEQVRGLIREVNNLKKQIMTKDKIIQKQDEKISDLEARLAEANARADTDELTGVYNPSYFKRTLNMIFQDNVSPGEQRVRTADTIVMIDLDGLKAVNDSLGHAAGDAFIKTAAHMLKSSVRESDTVARMGGDEFAIILRGATHADSQIKVRQISDSFNNLTCMWDNMQLHVRGSVGSSPVDWEQSPEQNIAAADAAMYEVKRARKCNAKRRAAKPALNAA